MKIQNACSNKVTELIGPNELKERLDDYKASQKSILSRFKRLFTKSK